MGTPVRFGVRFGNVTNPQTLETTLSAAGAVTKDTSFTILPA
jgi:hypothetical protein